MLFLTPNKQTFKDNKATSDQLHCTVPTTQVSETNDWIPNKDIASRAVCISRFYSDGDLYQCFKWSEKKAGVSQTIWWSKVLRTVGMGGVPLPDREGLEWGRNGQHPLPRKYGFLIIKWWVLVDSWWYFMWIPATRQCQQISKWEWQKRDSVYSVQLKKHPSIWKLKYL